MTFYQAIQTKEYPLFHELGLVFLASLLIALFANFSIPLPFTPVPLVLQSHIVLALGIFLGPRRAASAAVLFLTFGALGFPVFAGAVGGISKIFGVTGGYLAGYVISAYLTGMIYDVMPKKTSFSAFTAMAIGNLTLLFCGTLILALWVGWTQALILGALPFLVGDFIKLLAFTKVLQLTKSISMK